MPNLDKLILGIFGMLGIGLSVLEIGKLGIEIGALLNGLVCNIAFAIEAGGFTGAVGLEGSILAT